MKNQEDFKQEFEIVKEEGNQMKKINSSKLGVNISAV